MCVGVYCFIFLQVFQVNLLKCFSDAEKKKSNAVGTGEVRVIDGERILMFCSCQQSQSRQQDIPLKVHMKAAGEKASE